MKSCETVPLMIYKANLHVSNQLKPVLLNLSDEVPLTLIRAAIKKSVAGRLKVIYDPHIVQWEAGFL